MSSEILTPGYCQVPSNNLMTTKRGTSRRVLLVDDSASTARVTARLFSLLGHEVAIAHTGEAAIATALRFLPDVILLDLNLPDMHGCEVAKELRAEEELNHTLLVALTGYSDQATREEAEQAGFDEFLIKPTPLEGFEQLFLHPKLSVASAPHPK